MLSNVKIFHSISAQSNKSLFLLKGSKYEISEEDVNEYEKIMRLTIKSWQKADESHFTCISTNSLGKADGKIQAYSKFYLFLDSFSNSIIRLVLLVCYKILQNTFF